MVNAWNTSHIVPGPSPPKPSPMLHCPYPPPEVVADTHQYYYRDVNGDMIRIKDLPFAPLRSPESLRDAIVASDTRKAEVLIKAIIDEIINKTDVMPATIRGYRHQGMTTGATAIVDTYFESTPYRVLRSADGCGGSVWQVHFRPTPKPKSKPKFASAGTEYEVDFHKRSAPESPKIGKPLTRTDMMFLLGCVIVCATALLNIARWWIT